MYALWILTPGETDVHELLMYSKKAKFWVWLCLPNFLRILQLAWIKWCPLEMLNIFFLGFDSDLGRGCPWAGSTRPPCPSPRSFQSGIAGSRSPRPACLVWHKDMIYCPSKLSPSIQIIIRIIKIIALHQGHHVLPCQNFRGQKVICIITQARMERYFR